MRQRQFYELRILWTQNDFVRHRSFWVSINIRIKCRLIYCRCHSAINGWSIECQIEGCLGAILHGRTQTSKIIWMFAPYQPSLFRDIWYIVVQCARCTYWPQTMETWKYRILIDKKNIRPFIFLSIPLHNLNMYIVHASSPPSSMLPAIYR